jgi:hypothetical protein
VDTHFNKKVIYIFHSTKSKIQTCQKKEKEIIKIKPSPPPPPPSPKEIFLGPRVKSLNLGFRV